MSETAMKALSSIYARYITDLSFDNMLPDIIALTKLRILDFIGASLASYALLHYPRMVIEFMSDMGGTGESTILQTKRKHPAINAAFANAYCGHAVEMDDGHRFAALHPGTVIIPAALAAAELVKADTRQFILGVIAGYEVMIRIGMAISPSSRSRGFHNTGIVGVFGAAAAASKIMNLDIHTTINALGLAGLQGSGLVEIVHDERAAEAKPLNAANASRGGMLAAILARTGLPGPTNILEGKHGFLHAMAESSNEELLVAGLGQHYEISRCYTKFHSACRHTHAPIDAALEAFSQAQIKQDEIREIVIATNYTAIDSCGNYHVSTPAAARFSIPFSVALALFKGNADALQYSERNIQNASIQQLSLRVRLLVDGRWNRLYPQKRGATVTIQDSTGRMVSAEVDLAKGEPENPATHEDMFKKFYRNATMILSTSQTTKLGRIIMSLEDYSLSDMLQFI